jgi:hypothetical protein
MTHNSAQHHAATGEPTPDSDTTAFRLPTAEEYRLARREADSLVDEAHRRGTLGWSHIRMLRFRSRS